MNFQKNILTSFSVTAFDIAAKRYVAAIEEAYGHAEGLPNPSPTFSDVDRNGRWVLRNGSGQFLAYVTNTGKVLNRRFQTVEEI